jgi:hypothetical protein
MEYLTPGVLKVSEDTMVRDWRLAKAWPARDMRKTDEHEV